MREIISIQVGQCGNQVGENFWKLIAKEHAIDCSGQFLQNPTDDQLYNAGVFFNELPSGKYYARSILTDLEPGPILKITAGEAGKLFNPSNVIVAQNAGRNTYFAKGHYTDGAELCDSIMDAVRKETEHADSLQGFQFIFSLGGGTGSGLGTLLMSRIREAPSPKVSENVVEPYNATLAFHQIVENCDVAILLDNEAIMDMCTNKFKIVRPTYGDLNSVISLAMSNITSSCRFRTLLNSDLRRIAMNLTPFPRLHFFLTSLSPACPLDAHRIPDIPELLYDLFQAPNQLVSCDPQQGTFISGAITLRGQQCQNLIDDILSSFQNKYSSRFVEWIPDHLKSDCCNVTPPGHSLVTSLLSNNTCVTSMMKRIQNQFIAMFKRRAYLHGLNMEGMDEMEFTEAESNLNDLISEYKMYENGTEEVGNNNNNDS